MKFGYLVLVTLPLVQFQAKAMDLLNGQKVLREIQEINYDYEWTGIDPLTQLPCTLIVDADYENEIQITRHGSDISTAIAMEIFSMKSNPQFSKTSVGDKVIYNEFRTNDFPYSSQKVIEVIYDSEGETATVTLKNGPKDLGISCTVAYDP